MLFSSVEKSKEKSRQSAASITQRYDNFPLENNIKSNNIEYFNVNYLLLKYDTILIKREENIQNENKHCSNVKMILK